MRTKQIFVFCFVVMFSSSSFSTQGNEDGYHFLTQSRIINDISFSPSGEVLYVTDHNAIKAFIFESQKVIREFSDGHQAEILSIAISSDSTFMASGDRDGKILIWNLRSGEIENTFDTHSGQILSLDISPDNGHLASGATDNTITLYDLSNMSAITTFKNFNDHITGVQFSPDGQWMVAVAADGRVQLIDMNTKEVSSIQQDTSFLRGLDFEPTSMVLKTVGDDGFVTNWGISQGGFLHLRTIQKFSSNWLTSIQNTRSGNTFVVSNIRGQIKVITPFSILRKDLKVPVHKVIFRPGIEPNILVDAATRGKGVIVIFGQDMKLGR